MYVFFEFKIKFFIFEKRVFLLIENVDVEVSLFS